MNIENKQNPILVGASAGVVSAGIAGGGAYAGKAKAIKEFLATQAPVSDYFASNKSAEEAMMVLDPKGVKMLAAAKWAAIVAIPVAIIAGITTAIKNNKADKA